MNLFSGVTAVLSAAAESVICFEFCYMLPCCKWAVKMSCHNRCRLPSSVPSLLSLANWLKIIDWNHLNIAVRLGCLLRQSLSLFPFRSLSRVMCLAQQLSQICIVFQSMHTNAHLFLFYPPIDFQPMCYWWSSSQRCDASFWSKQYVRG